MIMIFFVKEVDGFLRHHRLLFWLKVASLIKDVAVANEHHVLTLTACVQVSSFPIFFLFYVPRMNQGPRYML